MNVTYTCPKCNGTGNLSHYRHVQGGVCFSCGGNGVKHARKAPVPSSKFLISAVLNETGQRIDVCYITAKSADEASVKAAARFAKGIGYAPESTVAIAA